MKSALSALNLFPYTQFWRVSTSPQHNNKCSILVSILVFLFIGAIFITEFIKVFSRTTIVSASSTIISPEPPLTTLVTSQTNQDFHPFMLAFDYEKNNPHINKTHPPFSISAYVQSATLNKTNQNISRTNETIPLEPCTSNHFSTFPNVQQKFPEWNGDKWTCLPLNKTFYLQGSSTLNQQYSRISILFNCNGTCSELNFGININFFILSSVINPNNGDAEQYFLDEISIPLTKNIHQKYSLGLTENLLDTDVSLFPWTSISTTHSIKTQRYKSTQRKENQSDSSTLLFLQRSNNILYHQRQYMKLLTAISYGGGVFQSILGVFLILTFFGRFFFELHFAKHYFRPKILRNFNYKSVIIQIAFKFLSAINCKPSWKEPQQLQLLQEEANKLMNVVYLHRRIDFLEAAISMLFQQHQLRGLRLIHNKNPKEAKEDHQKHWMKDKVKDLLRIMKNKQKEDNEEKTLLKKKRQIKIIELTPIQQHLDSSRDEVNPRFSLRDAFQELAKKGFKYQQNQSNVFMDETYIKQEGSEQKCAEDQIEDKEFEQKNQFQKQQQYLLVDQLEQDLLKLFTEAKMKNGDRKSKKIVSALDQWLKVALKLIIKKRKMNISDSSLNEIHVSRILSIQN